MEMETNHFVEVEATTTVANSWQVLTFDLTTAASFKTTNAYDRVILFPDFGVTGVGTTYYFDDIKQSNKILKMKKIIINTISIVILLLMVNCSKDDFTFGSLQAPSNLSRSRAYW
jgi:hypothetical protein